MTWVEQVKKMKREGFDLQIFSSSICVTSKATGTVIGVANVASFGIVEKEQREEMARDMMEWIKTKVES